jgi:hypothetical protein
MSVWPTSWKDFDPTGAPLPLPGLRSDLADLSKTSGAAAAALFKTESRLLTRLDSTNAAEFGCAEGMPEGLLFAADARVLGVREDFQSASVRLEVTSVAHANYVRYDGCTLAAASVQPRVRVDTLKLYLQRVDGRWEADAAEGLRLGSSTFALSGALPGIATADWDALASRADSIRRARNHTLARPWPAGEGHYDPYADDGLFYPAYSQPATCPSAPPPATVPTDQPELEFAPFDRGGMFPITGSWFAIYETEQGKCIAQVTVESSPGFTDTCPTDPAERKTPWAYAVQGVPRKPALLVRNVGSVRAGPAAESYTVVSGPGWEYRSDRRGWTEGALIFSPRGEVLRIVEAPRITGTPIGSGFDLNVWYRGRQYPFMRVDAAPSQTWGVYWVGLLNGDDVPDLVIRTTRRTGQFLDHELSLHLSSPNDRGTPWRWADMARVLVCG